MVLRRPTAGSRLLAALAVLAATTLACSDAQAPASPSARSRPGAPGAAAPGVQAAVDVSGRLRAPTPDEARALSLAVTSELSTAQARPVQVLRLANGALSIRLDESFQSTMLATTSGAGAHAACAGSEAETGRAPGLVAAAAEDR